MKELLISQIVPLLVTCIVAVLGVVIKAVGDAAIAYIQAKKDEVVKRIGSEKYKQEKELALDIWKIVEEHFRINELVEDKSEKMSKKVAMFDDLLMKKVPGITKEHIEFLRQTIAGELNKAKEALTQDPAKPKLPSADVPELEPPKQEEIGELD